MYLPSEDSKQIQKTIFSDSAGIRPKTQSLQGDIEVDVAVIGGGFVGMSAALHATEVGARVAVLEANQIGWGSSGRNAGQVSAHASKLEPEDVLRVYGAEYGRRLNEAGAAAPQFVRDLATKYSIDISLVEGGVVSAAHTPKAMEKFKRRAEYWQRHGAPVEFLDAQRTEEALGSPLYIGGVIDRRAMAINPLAFIFGLARAASVKGAMLFEHTKALRLQRNGRRWEIETASGTVVAESVLLCTNAYTDDLWPGLRSTIIPVRAYQIWTKPLSDNLAKTILPKISAFNDSRRLISGARKHHGGRLHFGGTTPAFGPEREPDTATSVQRIKRMFPQIDDLQIEGWWSGWVTRGIDDGWRLHELAPGLLTAIACNGRGVAMGPIMGRELARYVGGTPNRDLLIPLTQPKPILGYRVHKPFAAIAARYYRWRDEREIRQMIAVRKSAH